MAIKVLGLDDSKNQRYGIVEVPESYWVSKRSRNNMVAISMHLLNKKEEIRK
jgi:hypothetical protein